MGVTIRYQGRICSEGWYERKPGMYPDSGAVVMPTEHAREILLRVRRALFGPLGPKIAAQPVSIADVDRLPEVTDTGGGRRPVEGSPVAVGFELAGSLVFESDAPEASAGVATKTIIEGVYVHPNGIRSTLEDLAEQNGRHGEITIQLTDVRYFWRDWGACYGMINHLRPGGGFDLNTVNKRGTRKGEPFTLEQVLRWLVHHLPGSPRLIAVPPEARTIIPQDLSLRWEIPSVVLEALLDRYQMDLCLTLANEVAILKRAVPHSVGNFVSAGLVITPDPRHLSVGPMVSERWNDVPQVVTVVGAPVHQNVTRHLFPVSLDTDGQIYPLLEVIERWGYSLSAALAQVTNDEQRQYVQDFERLEPDPRVRIQKIRIAQKYFFKMFQLGSAAWAPRDKVSNPELPMLDRAVRDDARPSRAEGTDALVRFLNAQESLGNEVALNARHRVRLEPPRIVGMTLMQVQSDNPEILIQLAQDQIEALELRRDRLLAILELERANILAAILQRKRLYQEQTGALREVGDIIKVLPDTPDGKTFSFEIPAGILSYKLQTVPDQELLRAAEEALQKEKEIAEKLFKQLQEEIGTLNDAINEHRRNIAIVRKKRAATFRPSQKIWLAVEGNIPSERFQVMPEIGVVVFQDPVVYTDRPWAKTLTAHRALGIVHPEITFGVEHKWGSPQDHVFASFGLGADGQVRVLDFMEQIPRNPYVVHDPGIVFYVDREGRAFNTFEVIDRMKEKARPILTAPIGDKAYRYVYDGFWPIDALNPTSSVTWRSDGDSPYTEILVNDYQHAPRGRSVDAKAAAFGAGALLRMLTHGRPRAPATSASSGIRDLWGGGG